MKINIDSDDITFSKEEFRRIALEQDGWLNRYKKDTKSKKPEKDERVLDEWIDNHMKEEYTVSDLLELSIDTRPNDYFGKPHITQFGGGGSQSKDFPSNC